MDAVSKCIFDLVAFDGQYPRALNIVHPRTVKWDMVMGYIKEALRLQRATTLPFVSFQQWVELLESRSIAQEHDDLRRIVSRVPTCNLQSTIRKVTHGSLLTTQPAIKLQDFFKQLSDHRAASKINNEVFGTAEFSTTKMEGLSNTLATITPLTQEDANRWIKYWDNGRFFE